MQICESNFSLLKYADDIDKVGLMVRGKGDLERAYFEHIDHLLAWCEDSGLSLNASKTKELIISTREGQPTCQPIIIVG